MCRQPSVLSVCGWACVIQVSKAHAVLLVASLCSLTRALPPQEQPALPLGAFDRGQAIGGFSLFARSPVAQPAAAAGLPLTGGAPAYQLFGPARVGSNPISNPISPASGLSGMAPPGFRAALPLPVVW